MATNKHPLHSMCSYLGCYPPSVPRVVINSYVPSDAVVLDPFCGSGTTLVESVQLGRPCVGVDLNPLAVAISRAKVQPIVLEDVLDRILELAQAFPGTIDTDGVPEGLRIIFHQRTLAQLVYLRDALRTDLPEDIFLKGVILGLMHGKFRKVDSSAPASERTAYLSIDMPNTFSMSPEYVRKFVKKHRLKQLPIDAFGKLRQRVTWLLREGSLPPTPPATVLRGDATKLPTVLRQASIAGVDAIVTSPPYLGVLRYGAFNWIRLWFLGAEPAPVDRMLDGTDSLDRYLSFLSSFLCSAAEILPRRAPLIMVIGDVVEFGHHLPLAERVWQELSGVAPFELDRIVLDRFDESVKTTRIWGEGKKGRATPVDRMLVLRRKSEAAANTGESKRSRRDPLRTPSLP